MSSSSAERSNSTSSTSTLQPVFDIKKARDQYEKILKQLEVGIIDWRIEGWILFPLDFEKRTRSTTW